MIQAVSRLAAHDMLSGNALNAWWVVTWIVRSLDGLERGWLTAFTTPVRILAASRFMEVGYPNPKPIGTALVLVAIGWGIWRGRRLGRLADWAFLGGWCVFAYAMFGAQVHENHLYLAVPWLAIAAGLGTRVSPAVLGVVARDRVQHVHLLRAQRRLAGDHRAPVDRRGSDRHRGHRQPRTVRTDDSAASTGNQTAGTRHRALGTRPLATSNAQCRSARSRRARECRAGTCRRAPRPGAARRWRCAGLRLPAP